jgi:hypothetical protein
LARARPAASSFFRTFHVIASAERMQASAVAFHVQVTKLVAGGAEFGKFFLSITKIQKK